MPTTSSERPGVPLQDGGGEVRPLSPRIGAAIDSIEQRLAKDPPGDVEVGGVYASRNGPWLKRVHEVLYSWSLKSELPPGWCTYRYSGMKTALTKKCEKSVKQDALTKLLRILDKSSVIARPEHKEMVRLAREGLGYPVKVLVPPPGAQDVQSRILQAALAGVEESVVLDAIYEYLDARCLAIAGHADEVNMPW